jgi:hypothetical protein
MIMSVWSARWIEGGKLSVRKPQGNDVQQCKNREQARVLIVALAVQQPKYVVVIQCVRKRELRARHHRHNLRHKPRRRG